MLKTIDIQNLQPGMVIVRITKQNGPVRIRKSGLVTSNDMVQGLIEMGIQQVEIDQAQSVEIEAPAITKSPTRKMLESNKVTNTRIDDGLSEQFNRSLFLPSVQDIPSAWWFYAKRYLLAAFITLGGLGLGWTFANYQSVLLLINSMSDKALVSTTASVPEPVIPAKQVEDNISPPQVDNLEPAKADTDTDVAQQQVVATDNIEENSESSKTEQTVNALSEPEPQIEQASQTEPEPQISADVLARFRKAIAEVEDLPVTSPQVETTNSNEDVLRIDQLPAWVMNRLPSMAFSAHMYASIESERWVRVNGTRMIEGDKIDGMVEIIRIEPQHVILDYSGHIFSMAALTDW